MTFSLGRIVSTRGALQVLSSKQLAVHQFLGRHQARDWGDLSEEDHRANDSALLCGDRLFSSYHLDPEGEVKLWIITEADRSATTLLLPSEY